MNFEIDFPSRGISQYDILGWIQLIRIPSYYEMKGWAMYVFGSEINIKLLQKRVWCFDVKMNNIYTKNTAA